LVPPIQGRRRATATICLHVPQLWPLLLLLLLLLLLMDLLVLLRRLLLVLPLQLQQLSCLLQLTHHHALALSPSPARLLPLLPRRMLLLVQELLLLEELVLLLHQQECLPQLILHRTPAPFPGGGSTSRWGGRPHPAAKGLSALQLLVLLSLNRRRSGLPTGRLRRRRKAPTNRLAA
jgi:hypothetical protein